MLTKQILLLAPFIKYPWKRFTFKDIKQLTKNSSEGYVYSGLKSFVKQSVLKEEKAGNVTLYTIAHTLDAVGVLGFAAERFCRGHKHIPFGDLEKLAKKIPTPFYSLIITGSYAKNKQTRNSDLDLVILTDGDAKAVHAALRNACELNIPEIHLYVFRAKEFLEMLTNKEANYGKAIAQDNLIVSGGATYFRVLCEAISDGFGDKSLSGEG